MAAMIDGDRQAVARQWVEHAFVRRDQTATMDHAAIKSAVDAADDWVDVNGVTFNAILPIAFRTTATVAQKSLLLAYVILKRSGL